MRAAATKAPPISKFDVCMLGKEGAYLNADGTMVKLKIFRATIAL